MNVVLLKSFVKNGLSTYCDLKDFFLYNYMQLFSMHSVYYTAEHFQPINASKTVKR